MTDKRQTLEVFNIDKIYALEKLTTDKEQGLKIHTNEDMKATQTQTEEFRAELTIPLRYETGEEQPKVIRTPT